MELDLHGMKHEEAKRALERTINAFWCSGEEFKIITGHSDKMKKIVIDILYIYDLDYSIGDFSGLNTGYIKTVLD